MMTETTDISRRLVLAGAGAATLATLMPWAQVAKAADGSLFVIAELVARKGQEAALRDALTGFAKSAPQENGCLSYRLLEDVKHPGRFLTYESWTGEAALQAHLTSPAMAAARPTLGKILAKPFALTELKLLV
jgi:quinol monooxygenase YgiN